MKIMKNNYLILGFL